MGEKVKELIDIVAEKTKLSKVEIRKKIKKKQSELSGLVSEDGAAYIIANELGIKTRNRVIETTLKVQDVMPEMRSVTLFGRVKNLMEPREFTTKTGGKGKVANLDVVDDTGTMRIVLWNMSDIEAVEKKEVNIGDIVQVKNGYVREGFRGGHEINVGNKGRLVLKPEDVKEADYPKVEEGGEKMKISEITPGMSVSVVGRVTHNFGINEFEKEDRKGQVANIIINDGTGGLRLVMWNEQATLADDVEIGDILAVNNAYAKEGMRGSEAHANWATRFDKNPEGVNLPEIKAGQNQRTKIADLKDGDTYKEICGAIVDVYGSNFVYDMCPNCNKKVNEAGKCDKCGEVAPDKLVVVNTMMDDGSGLIRASFFRDNAEKLFGMNALELQGKPEKVKEQTDGLLGKEVTVEGRVKRNDAFDRLEFNVYNLRDTSPAEEAGKIADNL